MRQAWIFYFTLLKRYLRELVTINLGCTVKNVYNPSFLLSNFLRS